MAEEEDEIGLWLRKWLRLVLRLEAWLGSAKESEEMKRYSEVEIERKSEKHMGREEEYRLRREEILIK